MNGFGSGMVVNMGHEGRADPAQDDRLCIRVEVVFLCAPHLRISMTSHIRMKRMQEK